MSLKIDSIGGSCPCQAEGEMDGHPFYFRARYGKWTLMVVPPGQDTVFNEHPDYFAQGDDPDIGYMSEDEAKRIIEVHYQKFTDLNS